MSARQVNHIRLQTSKRRQLPSSNDARDSNGKHSLSPRVHSSVSLGQKREKRVFEVPPWERWRDEPAPRGLRRSAKAQISNSRSGFHRGDVP